MTAEILISISQQCLQGLVRCLLRLKTAVTPLTCIGQNCRYPQIRRGLTPPEQGASSGRFTAHGNTDPANRGLASAFTDRQNGESPWLAKTEGAATSGCSGN